MKTLYFGLFISLVSCGSPIDYVDSYIDIDGLVTGVESAGRIARAENYSYEFDGASCTTGEQEHPTLVGICEILLDDTLNNECAKEKRDQLFNNECV